MALTERRRPFIVIASFRIGLCSQLLCRDSRAQPVDEGKEVEMNGYWDESNRGNLWSRLLLD
jgi:hypothetical protein